MFEVELLAIAEIELSESYDWYEEQQAGLGDRFFNEIEYYLTVLEKNPYIFPVKYVEELRTVTVNKFPFLIIFWVDINRNKIYVVSIFHTSRNPRVF